MTTWTQVSDPSSSWEIVVSQDYVTDDYVVSDYFTTDLTWTEITSPTTVWT